MRKLVDALAFAALVAVVCAWSVTAFGQANNSNTWQTPGNQTVGGIVNLCPNSSNLAVPCAVGPVAGSGLGSNGVSATMETASATGTTTAITATLAASAGKFTYICGFSINSTATAAAAGNATVTNTITGTLNYEMGTGTSPAVVVTSQVFTPCIPASAANTTIVVTTAAAGTGGVISVTATGYQQ